MDNIICQDVPSILAIIGVQIIQLTLAHKLIGFVSSSAYWQERAKLSVSAKSLCVL
jgi:hypothetical protein